MFAADKIFLKLNLRFSYYAQNERSNFNGYPYFVLYGSIGTKYSGYR